MPHNTTDLVQILGQNAFTDSETIAFYCDKRSHRSTLQLIRKHLSLFEELGEVTFHVRLSTQGSEKKLALLNEDQATFLITLFRNTSTVVSFKLKLIKAFRKAIDEIKRLYANPPRHQIIQEKRDSHLDMTDALVENRYRQDKETGKTHFRNENKLCNWIITGEFKKINEKSLCNSDAERLTEVRRLNQSMLEMDMPYEQRKEKLKLIFDRKEQLIAQTTHSKLID
jgi:phage regulator Rha-like protein